VWIFQGCGAVVKMTLLQLGSSSFLEDGSGSGPLGFHERGSGALFFHGSSSCLFSHINISIRGRSRGRQLGRSPPSKTNESYFIYHDFVQFGKLYSQYNKFGLEQLPNIDEGEKLMKET